MGRLAVGVSTPSRASILSIALAALTACASVPERQGAIPVEMGQRVRITLASRAATGPLQGTVVSVSPDTLLIAREEGGERRLSRSQVEEVEVSVARTSEPGKAVGYGVLVVAPLIGIALVFALTSEYGFTVFGLILAPVAAVAAVGGLIGSGPQDVWVKALWPAEQMQLPADSLPEDPR